MPAKKGRSQHLYRFAFDKYQTIGQPAAESEKSFDEVFIETPAYCAVVDISSPKCILIGRTGSGKSALVRRLVETQSRIKRISPEEMSLRFLSNSTILDYLRTLGVNLNFFYKILWKHVFVVELINLYAGDNDSKRMTFFQRLRESFTGEQQARKELAIAYLEEFSNDFWGATEVRVKTMERTLENNLSKELGINSDVFKASVGQIKKDINREQSEVKYKAEQVINQLQAEKLFEVLNVLKDDVFFNHQKKYFLVIDDLDKEWVSQQIVYDLIAAMVDVVQDFQIQLKGVKIVLSLRDNLHMLAIAGSDHRGSQREKLAALDLPIKWTKEELIELLDIRLKYMSEDKLGVDNLFEREYKQEGIAYILERTYMRPRALISYVNKIIEHSDNKHHFTRNLVKIAEPYYSTERILAIDDEWRENYGDVSKVCQFLNGGQPSRSIAEITENDFEFLYLTESFEDNFKGRLFEICKSWKDDKLPFQQFKMELLHILYIVGIIGVKLSSSRPVYYYYDQIEIVRKEDFNDGVKIYVHKALYSFFKTNSREQQIDVFRA